MSLRARITLLTAGAVAISIALVALIIFLAERSELRAEVDSDLRDRAAVVAAELLVSGGDSALREERLGELPAYAQVVRRDGAVLPLVTGGPALAVDARARAVAAGQDDRFYADVEAEGQQLRVLTVPLRNGALQLAEPLGEVNQQLVYLASVLAAVTLGGLSIAALLGLLVARSALKPLTRLTAGAERVATTRDLSTRLDVGGTDELSRLASTLNTMLEALDTSQHSQRQLVTDASHELRTPLSSMRTNLEVLDEIDEIDQLPAGERQRLVADLRAELEGLIATVGDLLDLARDEEHEEPFEEVAFDRLVEESVSWATRRFPHVRFETSLRPRLVRANGTLVQRAIGNLLDNAAKWSPRGSTVRVALDAESLTVRDNGPGIDAKDLPHLFERFYRAPAARGLPGSGLGLSIVRQVVDAHGWQVSAENADGGGSRFRIDLTDDSSPALRRPSPPFHPARVQLAAPAHQTSRRGRRPVLHPARLGLMIMAVVPLLAALGTAVLADDDEPTRLRTLVGTLEPCADRLCVGDSVVDFGPSWYVGTAEALYDYDGDGELGMLAAELAGLVGREVTLETDGGLLDQDVFTIDGLPLRDSEGELPAPERATTSASLDQLPPEGDSHLAGALERCGADYCLAGIRLDFGPVWFLSTAQARHDYDGDGRLCSLATEIEGLVGANVDVSIHADEDANVISLEGLPYRDPDAEPPWAGGPLFADSADDATC